MTPKQLIDRGGFAPEAISEETHRQNQAIIEQLADQPDKWAFPPHVIRENRAEGKGPIPLSAPSDRARSIVVEGRSGQLTFRVIPPAKGAVEGVYLHIHGGGWMLGASDEQDIMLERIADKARLVCLSIEYRLAPEHPYPAAPDDCQDAALWLIENTQTKFGTGRLMIGGESAGANLAAVTLLRLREKFGSTGFSGAVFTAGCYDLALTPSARLWGATPLILNTRDIERFVKNYILDWRDRRDPDISPLFGQLHGLPPALFSVGTMDPLLDDTLFMAQRYLAVGNTTDLAVYPGGCHMFHAFPSTLAEGCLTRIEEFLSHV